MSPKGTLFSRCIDIAAPPDRVWQLMSDVERWSEWTASVRSIRRLDKGPLAIGSRAWVRQPRLLPGVWTVTALEPERSFTWTTGVPGLFAAEGSHAIEVLGEVCRVTLSLRFRGVLGAMMARILKNTNNRYLALEADGLKLRSESGR